MKFSIVLFAVLVSFVAANGPTKEESDLAHKVGADFAEKLSNVRIGNITFQPFDVKFMNGNGVLTLKQAKVSRYAKYRLNDNGLENVIFVNRTDDGILWRGLYYIPYNEPFVIDVKADYKLHDKTGEVDISLRCTGHSNGHYYEPSRDYALDFIQTTSGKTRFVDFRETTYTPNAWYPQANCGYDIPPKNPDRDLYWADCRDMEDVLRNKAQAQPIETRFLQLINDVLKNQS
jgi:hypothetical protein